VLQNQVGEFLSPLNDEGLSVIKVQNVLDKVYARQVDDLPGITKVEEGAQLTQNNKVHLMPLKVAILW